MSVFGLHAPELRKTAWFPGQTMPARPGYYEVGHDPRIALGIGSYYWLRGPRVRYFDGKVWLTDKDGPVSVFGKHASHRWRGLRKSEHLRQAGFAATASLMTLINNSV